MAALATSATSRPSSSRLPLAELPKDPLPSLFSKPVSDFWEDVATSASGATCVWCRVCLVSGHVLNILYIWEGCVEVEGLMCGNQADYPQAGRAHCCCQALLIDVGNYLKRSRHLQLPQSWPREDGLGSSTM